MSPDLPWMVALGVVAVGGAAVAVFVHRVMGATVANQQATMKLALAQQIDVLGNVITHQEKFAQDLLDRLMAKVPEQYFGVRMEENSTEEERPPVPMRAVGERLGPTGE